MQQFWDSHQAAISGAITWVVFFVATFVARYKIPPSNWFFQFLRVFLGAVVDAIHPAQFKEVAAQAKTKAKKKSKAIDALNASLLLLTLAATLACGGSLQKQLNVVMVVEQQAQTYSQDLLPLARDAINMMPIEKKADALAKLNEIQVRLTNVFSAKDKALQDAIAADSAANLNVPQLIGDIASAIQALVDLVKVFGVDANHADAVGTEMKAAHVKALAIK